MSLYNDASLVLIPSGYKEGKLYSIKPTDGGGDFTFSRASSATRVNSSGLIEKETQNLLLQSNTFNTTWTQSDISTLTSGQSGYDGTNDAWLVEKSASSNGYLRQYISSSGVHTFSVYAKSDTLNGVLIQTRGASTKSAQFDLSTGTIGTLANNIDAKIEDIGSGWYRCSVSVNDSGITEVRIFICDDGTTIGTTAGSIYIQDAQLNQGLVADSYLETTTTAVYGGITDDLPRLDYTDASCPSLLLEPQRTNLVPYSEYANGWTTNGTGSITDNAETSPEGYINAFTLNDTSTGTYYRIEENITLSSGKHTFSVFVKKTSGALSHYAGVQLDSSRAYVIIDTTNGTYNEYLGTTNDSVRIDDFNSDWWRVIITNNITAGSIRIAIWPALSENGTSIQTSATGENSFYGAQLEQGSAGMAIPTSYIPTYGTAVTRVSEASAFELSVFDFFSLSNTESGTFFIETKFINQGNSYVDTFGQGGTGTNVWQNTDFVMLDTVSSNSFVVQNLTSVIDDYVKILIRKDQTTYNVFINGVKSATTNTITNPLKWFDHIALFRNTQMVKQMIEFPTALTDSECIALTTL